MAKYVTLFVLPWFLNSTAQVLQADSSLCPSPRWLHDGLDAKDPLFIHGIRPHDCHSLKFNQHRSEESALSTLDTTYSQWRAP